jgi:hypothetical protein
LTDQASVTMETAEEKCAQKERAKEKMPPHTPLQERHSNGKKKNNVYI